MVPYNSKPLRETHNNYRRHSICSTSRITRQQRAAAASLSSPQPPPPPPEITILWKNQIPITSAMGQQLIAKANKFIDEGKARAQVERYEQFCAAITTTTTTCNNWPKSVYRKTSKFHHTTRRYNFPQRQFSAATRRDEAAVQLRDIQLKETACKPVEILVNRLSDAEITKIKAQVRRTGNERNCDCV